MGITRFIVPLISLLATTGAASARDVAVCGNSVGQGYYPAAGLSAIANKTGKWDEDNITSGRITLSQVDQDGFDILFTDATGVVVSAKGDGATVVRVGQNDFSIAILVVYPLLTETYTFLRSKDGPEVMWTTNKHSTPVVKVGAYRAACTLLNLPPS